MENIISNLITEYSKMQDEVIINALQRYILFTGNKNTYDLLKDKYNDRIDIRYSEYLSQDKNIYLLNLDSVKAPLKPITLEYEQPHFEYDPRSMTMKGNARVRLMAGDKIL